jgi:hypothetical protein
MSDFGSQMATEIAEKFGTRDVYEIARIAGVALIYQSWYPITIGEFERKTKTIRVNLRALENDKTNHLENKIIAHELGHFFATDLKLDKNAEEIFAHNFAENLCKPEGRN